MVSVAGFTQAAGAKATSRARELLEAMRLPPGSDERGPGSESVEIVSTR
jgi:hypothetical protein